MIAESVVIRFPKVCLLLLLFCLPLRGFAQPVDDTYLTNQATFDAAWKKLITEMGAQPDLVSVQVTPDTLEVIARAAAGGARIDVWKVTRDGPLILENVITGPAPLPFGGPTGDIEGAFFASAEVPFDRLVEIASHVLTDAPFQDPGRVTEVKISRKLVLLPSPSHGEVHWNIDAGTTRETASAEATADGVLYGLDISGTVRGQTRNFLTQDDWPLADAQNGFENLIGAAADIFEIRVLRGSISATTRRADAPDTRTTISWDGSRYTRGLVDLPAVTMAEGEPFRFADLPLAKLPEVIRTAWAQVEGRDQRLEKVRAHHPDLTRGTHGLHWEVSFVDRTAPLITNDDVRTIVRLSAQAQVASVQLPVSLRPTSDFLATDWMIWSAQAFAQGFDAETAIFEAIFEEKQAEIIGVAAGSSDMKSSILLDQNGFRLGSEFPIMMETPQDLFKVGVLAGLDAARLESIKLQAIKELAIPDGEVYRVKLWSGSPFYPLDPMGPMFYVRVGVPPSYRSGGYAVFRFDGTFVEAIR